MSALHPDGRRYGGTHSYGLIPDPADLVTKSATPFLAGASLTPSSASLAKFLPPVVDQYPESCCVGAAATGALETAFAAKGRPVTARSMQGVYTLGRCAARESTAPLDDRGSVPSAVMQALTEWGAPSEASWPFDPSKVNEEPRFDELEAADLFRLSGFYRIDTFGSERLDEIMLAIANGHPVFFTCSVDSAFENWSSADPIGAMAGPSLGGHALFAYGYETTPSGLVVSFRNSWGHWCQQGNARGNEAFIAGWSSLYIIDPSGVS